MMKRKIIGGKNGYGAKLVNIFLDTLQQQLIKLIKKNRIKLGKEIPM